MSVIGLNDGIGKLTKLPIPNNYLGPKAKKHYERIGKILITAKVLKSLHIPALEILAENYEQWEWAVREIRKKNREKAGSGYIQIYQSKAKNISAELTVKRDAEKAIMQCIKQFGLDPKSEKDLKASVDPNQGVLDFSKFLEKKTS